MRSKVFTLVSTFIMAMMAYWAVGMDGAVSLVKASPTSKTNSVMLSIPSVDISAPIVPIAMRQFDDGSVTWDTSDLTMNVGHLQGLPWFGQGGNVVLGGHSELARGQADVFYNLDKVQLGDEIIVWDEGRNLRYIVREITEVDRDNLSILQASDREILTIMTCELDSFAEGGIYETRLVLIAERVV